jgi:membrane peptidoglycan carboxypeptidase
MYPGRGETMSAKDCAINDCDDNTAVYTREQVGSSFKPYVLTAAVLQGMNVGTSTLDTSPYVCVAPDGSTTYSAPLTGSAYAADSSSTSGTGGTGGGACTLPDGATDGYPVQNDGGELIGKQVAQAASGATYYSSSVQNALAMSSNTGFTDLAHKVGTKNIVTVAGDYGVDLDPYDQGGSGLPSYEGGVGMALGIAPLTVNEQTTMLATIDNGGMYHAAHIIDYWQTQADGQKNLAHVVSHSVLTPAQDSEVEYAMDETTTVGTAVGSVTLDRPLISKTGTTSDSHSGFFIGAIPQYAMVVGMFTSSQDSNSSDNLAELGGGGFGGYWPAKIWNTFATAEFNNLPVQNLPTAQFSGSTWNLLGPLPAKKPSVTCTVNGKRKKINAKTCPTPTPAPTPTATCQYQGDPTCGPGGYQPTPNPTSSCSYDPSDGQFDDCTSSGSPDPSPSPTCSYDSSDNQFDDCSGDGNGNGGGGNGNGGGNGDSISATPLTSTGPAVAGGVLILPGTLLFTSVSRRRRRNKRARKAE